MKKYIILGSTMFLIPTIALAAGLADVIATVGGLINLLVPVVISAAVLFFLYGLAVYMWSVGDKKEDGKDMMIWGVIALFVMVSVWGLVNLLGDTFNLDTTAKPIPTLPINQ